MQVIGPTRLTLSFRRMDCGSVLRVSKVSESVFRFPYLSFLSIGPTCPLPRAPLVEGLKWLSALSSYASDTLSRFLAVTSKSPTVCASAEAEAMCCSAFEYANFPDARQDRALTHQMVRVVRSVVSSEEVRQSDASLAGGRGFGVTVVDAAVDGESLGR